MLIFPNAKKIWNLLCIEEPLEFHSEENYYYRLLYKKEVFTVKFHKDHLKIMLLPADENSL